MLQGIPYLMKPSRYVVKQMPFSLAAIGSPLYDSATVRPEQGLLALRKELNLYANIRPVKILRVSSICHH